MLRPKHPRYFAHQDLLAAPESVVADYSCSIEGGTPVILTRSPREPDLPDESVQVAVADERLLLTVNEWLERTELVAPFVTAWVSSRVRLEGAGMPSMANLNALAEAGLKLIVGSRPKKAPGDLTNYFHWNGNAFHDGQLTETIPPRHGCNAERVAARVDRGEAGKPHRLSKSGTLKRRDRCRAARRGLLKLTLRPARTTFLDECGLLRRQQPTPSK